MQVMLQFPNMSYIGYKLDKSSPNMSLSDPLNITFPLMMTLLAHLPAQSFNMPIPKYVIKSVYSNSCQQFYYQQWNICEKKIIPLNKLQILMIAN